MSSPTINIQGLTIKGYGLALVNVSIDQDCAYWEWHVNIDENSHSKKKNNHYDMDDDFFNNGVTLKVGVATRKDQAFYHILNANEEDGKRIFFVE